MKKKFASLLLIAILLCVAFSAVLIGCSGTKVTYTVTVLLPDESPVQGVTVSWQQAGKSKGSAVTGTDGVASADLSAETYAVVLSGLADGLTYTSISLTEQMNSVRLKLSYIKVDYQATVLDKNGEPVEGATVSWVKDAVEAGNAQTDENGLATCELAYGDYTVVVTDGLPTNNVTDGTLTASGADPVVTFNLIHGTPYNYLVTVRTEGGLMMGKTSISVERDGEPYYTTATNAEGVCELKIPIGNYTVQVVNLSDGYTAQPIQLSEEVLEGEIVLHSEVIQSEPAAGTRYVMGDIIHDYSFTTPYKVDGEQITYKISEILKTKQAVLINNWGTQCTWCDREMPSMEEAYQTYKDDIEIIAISNYQGGDRDNTIIEYRTNNGYTFPMMRDNNGLATRFGIRGWPATIVIDRYGAIARIESGAILDSEVWGRLIKKYIGDDYVQDFVPGSSESDSINTEKAKPDIELAENHYENIAAAMNNTATFPQGASIEYYGETKNEFAWPFLLGTVDGVSPNSEVLSCSNTTKANSMSILYATVTVDAGQMLVFDYWSQTEENVDIFYLYWDGKIVSSISGDSDGWQTCYLYADLVDGEHTLGLTYMKDYSVDEGKDNVYLRNFRFISLSSLEEPLDFLRGAAYGPTKTGDTKYPYYAPVSIAADGYYHVTLSGLENFAYAGGDQSPMLFANLLGATNWSINSVADWAVATDEKTGEYLVDCNLTVNGVTKDYRDTLIKWSRVASASDLYGFVPVDKDLYDLLVEFMKAAGKAMVELNPDLAYEWHANKWLEICYFYSHYGDGETVGIPIVGLTEKTATEVGVGTSHADLTRVMAPFPSWIYTFTPTEDGLYLIESLIPDEDKATLMGQIWLYDDTTSIEKPLAYCGDDYITRDGTNEHNFAVYRYMTAGHKYYFAVAFLLAASGEYDFRITNIGSSKEVFEPASGDFYWQILDDKGNFSGYVELANAIEYEKDEEGYYHAINADGTRGDYIYLDVKYPRNVSGGRYSLRAIINQYVKNPEDGTNLDFKQFDFSKRIAYFEEKMEDESLYVTWTDLTISSWGEEYKDYTAIMQGYVDEAMQNTGDMEGLVRVDQQLVDILSLYIETRNNMLLNNVYEEVLENEWLRFCWYFKLYDADNVG